MFILICENSSLLLPTVRSRAPVFRTQSFSDKELSTYLITLNDEAKKLKERDEEAFNRVIKVADGSIGMAISALDKKAYNKLTDKRDTVLSMLEALVGVEKSVFYSFEDELPSKRDELSSLIADLKSAFRDILLRKKSMGVNYLYFSSDEEVQRFSSVMTAGRLLDAIDCCDKALRSNEMNANVNLMKINFICALWKCVH